MDSQESTYLPPFPPAFTIAFPLFAFPPLAFPLPPFPSLPFPSSPLTKSESSPEATCFPFRAFLVITPSPTFESVRFQLLVFGGIEAVGVQVGLQMMGWNKRHIERRRWPLRA